MNTAIDDPLLQNPWFWLGETLQAILAASATIANGVILLEFTLSRPVLSIIPRDIRYLYCNKALCALLLSVSILIKCLLTFTHVRTEILSYYTKTAGGGRRRIYYFDACQYQIGVAIAASISLIMTIMGSALQRLLAAFAIIPTKNVQCIRKKQRLSAPLFLMVSWLVALAMALCIVLIMPPRTDYWHECSAVYILPRSAVIATVVLVPIITLMSVLMQVAAWLSTKKDYRENDQIRSVKRDEETLGIGDPSENLLRKRKRLYSETTLTEMNLPGVLLFAVSWSTITLFFAYERLIPSFNPDRYLFNIYQKSPYYDDNGGFLDEKTLPPENTFILTQFFVSIPLLLELFLDPLFTYWKRPRRSHLVQSSSFSQGAKEEAKRLLSSTRIEDVENEDDKKSDQKKGSEFSEGNEKYCELHKIRTFVDIDEEM